MTDALYKVLEADCKRAFLNRAHRKAIRDAIAENRRLKEEIMILKADLETEKRERHELHIENAWLQRMQDL